MLAAPAEFQTHLAPVSGKFALFHGLMPITPCSVTHDAVHLKSTISGRQLLNVPPAQGVSCVDPAGQNVPSPQNAWVAGLLQKLPARHWVWTVEPCGQKLPAEHAMQVALETALAAVEKVPATQLAHVALDRAPLDVEKVPASSTSCARTNICRTVEGSASLEWKRALYHSVL